MSVAGGRKVPLFTSVPPREQEEEDEQEEEEEASGVGDERHTPGCGPTDAAK
jgi:hypothetical protein